MRKIFGTDGVRGVANIYPITCEMALALGRAVAYKARSGNHRHKIIIGKDTRLSCYMLEMSFAAGVCSMGVDVILLGPIPTPGVAFLTKDMRADAGVMITASHNPFADNGIKIFGRDGFKLSDEQEGEIEEYIFNHSESERSSPDFSSPTKDLIGKVTKMEDARGRYISHLKSVLPPDMDLCGMKIAIDCANGAAYKVAPAVFNELGADIIVIGNEPNGKNINESIGALHPEKLAQKVLEHKCDIGIALDGDADRLVVVNDCGKVVNGDSVLALAAKDLIEREGPRPIVTTCQSTVALDEFIKSLGGWSKQTNVGDRYVLQEMRKSNFPLGGESSGHIIYLDHSTTGDGVVAALKLLSMMKRAGKKLSELELIFKPYPQYMINMSVSQKTPLTEIPGLVEMIDEIEKNLDGHGRTLVRYSGTENLLRIMVEAEDIGTSMKLAEQIADIAKVIESK